jgi:hypothetical protein
VSEPRYKFTSGPDPFEGESPYPPELLTSIERWLRLAADVVGLRDWDVFISGGLPGSDTNIAETSFRLDSQEMTISLGKTFFDYPELRRRQALAHELMHGHVHPITKYARAILEGEVGKTGEAFFETSIASMEEQAVDRLGRAIALFLPESPGRVK